MMANVTTHKMTKLDKLRVLASEWSDQPRPDMNAVSSKNKDGVSRVHGSPVQALECVSTLCALRLEAELTFFPCHNLRK
jgi:hypothetical protein